jgi:hypothetical protein
MRRCETDLLNWFSVSIGPVDNRGFDDQGRSQNRCFNVKQAPVRHSPNMLVEKLIQPVHSATSPQSRSTTIGFGPLNTSLRAAC